MDDSTNLDSGVGGYSLDEATRIADERERKQEESHDDSYDNDDSHDEDSNDDDYQQPQADDDELEEVDYEGKKYQLPKHLSKALLRNADYTQKTQSLAEQRKAFEQHAQAVAQERNFYANHVSQIVQQLSANIQQLPSDAQLAQLAKTDPAAYVQARAERDVKIQELQQAQQIQQQIEYQKQIDSERNFAQTLEHERNSLLTKLPEWKNEKVAAKEKSDIAGYLTAEGYTQEDLSGLTDHRALLIARKAMLYDRMVKGNQSPQKQTQTQGKRPAPRALPAGAQRTGAPPKAPKEIVQKFKSSGSMQDALALLNSIT